MYDEVSNVLAKRIIENCPHCGKFLYDSENPAEWQTKDFKNLLMVVGLEDIDCDTFEMHTICPHCNVYMSANVTLTDGDYNIRTQPTGIVYEQFVDRSLVKEHSRARLDRALNRNTKSWLEYNSAEFYFDEDSDKEHLLYILRDIRDNYYVVPRENFGDLE